MIDAPYSKLLSSGLKTAGDIFGTMGDDDVTQAYQVGSKFGDNLGAAALQEAQQKAAALERQYELRRASEPLQEPAGYRKLMERYNLK